MTNIASSNFDPVGKATHNFTSSPVTVGNWVTISASLPAAVAAIAIFDTSGRFFKLSTGTAGNEAASELLFYVPPGGAEFMMPVDLPHGARLAVSPIDGDATTGFWFLNLYG